MQLAIDLINQYLDVGVGINGINYLEEDDDGMFAARLIAEKAHAGQTRWNGDAYVTHPIRVAKQLILEDDKVVAFLHDVIEDTKLTLEDFKTWGFELHIIDAIDSVTKRSGENYLNFILRSKKNAIGRMVKVADIRDNLRDMPDNKKNMRDKYLLALWILENL